MRLQSPLARPVQGIEHDAHPAVAAGGVASKPLFLACGKSPTCGGGVLVHSSPRPSRGKPRMALGKSALLPSGQPLRQKPSKKLCEMNVKALVCLLSTPRVFRPIGTKWQILAKRMGISPQSLAKHYISRAARQNQTAHLPFSDSPPTLRKTSRGNFAFFTTSTISPLIPRQTLPSKSELVGRVV